MSTLEAFTRGKRSVATPVSPHSGENQSPPEATSGEAPAAAAVIIVFHKPAGVEPTTRTFPPYSSRKAFEISPPVSVPKSYLVGLQTVTTPSTAPGSIMALGSSVFAAIWSSAGAAAGWTPQAAARIDAAPIPAPARNPHRETCPVFTVPLLNKGSIQLLKLHYHSAKYVVNYSVTAFGRCTPTIGNCNCANSLDHALFGALSRPNT